MTRRKPWHMRSKGPAQTAYYLIMHAGNDVGKAHKYVTRVGRLMKKPRGRPPINDTWLLLIADAIRREHKHLGRDAQMRLAAKEAAHKPKAVAATLKRMRRMLGDRSLTEFAEGEPFVAVRRAPGRYELRLREEQRGEPIAAIEFFPPPDKNPRKSD